ncbi:MAG: threonine/serine dehydratase [Paracoccaceae bacterium]
MTQFAMIDAAATRLAGHARRPPLLTSPILDEIAGRGILVKPECLQHTGSFKFRGAWSALTGIGPAQRSRGVIAYSSGNHAQGIAMAAKRLNTKAMIVMPTDAPLVKIENTRALGAEVVLYERGVEAREEVGNRLRRLHGLTLIKPFDEPLVIAGQGTVGMEIAQQSQQLGVTVGDVLVCCGGGGLTSGIALALEELAPGLRARPVEPEGFDDVTRSLASGEIESNEVEAGGLCDAILTKSPGEVTFPIMKRLCGPGIVVTNEEVMRAMAYAFLYFKLVVEPGGAVALAAALFHGDELDAGPVTVVLSGGNVDPAIFHEALEKYGEQ